MITIEEAVSRHLSLEAADVVPQPSPVDAAVRAGLRLRRVRRIRRTAAALSGVAVVATVGISLGVGTGSLGLDRAHRPVQPATPPVSPTEAGPGTVPSVDTWLASMPVASFRAHHADQCEGPTTTWEGIERPRPEGLAEVCLEEAGMLGTDLLVIRRHSAGGGPDYRAVLGRITYGDPRPRFVPLVRGVLDAVASPDGRAYAALVIGEPAGTARNPRLPDELTLTAWSADGDRVLATTRVLHQMGIEGWGSAGIVLAPRLLAVGLEELTDDRPLVWRVDSAAPAVVGRLPRGTRVVAVASLSDRVGVRFEDPKGCAVVTLTDPLRYLWRSETECPRDLSPDGRYAFVGGRSPAVLDVDTGRTAHLYRSSGDDGPVLEVLRWDGDAAVLSVWVTSEPESVRCSLRDPRCTKGAWIPGQGSP
ncbi:MAG: hypothetical protein GXX79_21140 [Actinomycetales bacterium]|nr:hypothetical protein [Actinomycetales bacterium]